MAGEKQFLSEDEAILRQKEIRDDYADTVRRLINEHLERLKQVEAEFVSQLLEVAARVDGKAEKPDHD